jgi:concanavalin A-like lectin/glucanase superfamily protein
MRGDISSGLVLGLAALMATGCGEAGGAYAGGRALGDRGAALLEDGDASSFAQGVGPEAPPLPELPPRLCYDCRLLPLASWTFDDCRVDSTTFAAGIAAATEPAFRSVQTACVPGASEGGVRFASPGDIVYAPDQPRFVFDHELTLAAFVYPEDLTGTQTILRKRLGSSSAFVLAIDEGQVELVLHLEEGGAARVSAPIASQRWTHVAATYDGAQVSLYVDGALAASALAAGALKNGPGPLLIGNDVFERRFHGRLDEVWINDLVAPPELIGEMRCSRGPELALTPSVTPPQAAGDYVELDFALTSLADAACAPEVFEIFPAVPPDLETYSFGITESVAPGETLHTSVTIGANRFTPPGSYPYSVIAFGADARFSGAPEREGTFIVDRGPPACEGQPPLGTMVDGSVAPVPRPNQDYPYFSYIYDGGFAGVVFGLDLREQDVADGDSWGVDLTFGYDSCIDASAYTGVSFTVSGDLGSCQLAFAPLSSEDASANYYGAGACTVPAPVTADLIDASCRAPRSTPLGTGSHVIRFADLSGGLPESTVNPATLVGLQWWLAPSSDPDAPPCVSEVQIRDIAFAP